MERERWFAPQQRGSDGVESEIGALIEGTLSVAQASARKRELSVRILLYIKYYA